MLALVILVMVVGGRELWAAPGDVDGGLSIRVDGAIEAVAVDTDGMATPLAIGALTNGVLDQAIARDMTVLAWSPLGQGRLGDPQDDRARAVAAALDLKAEAYGVSRAAAAYSWIMAHPSRPIPIVGTQTPARIAEIPDAFKPRWTRADWYQVLVASMGEPLP